ncbi:hypothetical protein [Nocardia sp. NPDC051463]|uniref:hypothetical protein n=1 Tax=Nocardia sp. NPDC051463 TaxID=3154845 RepID=UPI00344FECDA
MSATRPTVDQIADAVHRIMSLPNPITGTDGYDEVIRRALGGPVPPPKDGGSTP